MRAVKFIITVLSAPFLISASYAFYAGIGGIYSLDENQRFFIIGAVTYLIVHTVLFKPNFIYIFGHEMTHAIATFISFGKVKSFKVSKKGGEVKTTKSNFFISLAPYFFPTYTLIIILAWFIAGKFMDVNGLIYPFFFAVGFTLVFHFVMTVEFLKVKQPDLIKSGYLFSIALIYMVNVSLAALILNFVFGDFSFKVYANTLYSSGMDIYSGIFKQLFSLRGY